MVLPLGDLERTRITPYVTYALIAVNVMMFLLQESRDDHLMALACTPWEITHNDDVKQPVIAKPASVALVRDPRDPTGRTVLRVERPAVTIPHAPAPIPVWMTLLTAMFLHGGWMHLLGNMLYLWIVGDNVEEVLGPVLYVVVYLACGLMGSLAQIAANPESLIPTLGASGAIAGIMGAYVVWFPHHQMRVLVFRFITVLPAAIVIGGWIVLQVILGSGSFSRVGESGGVAYLAHVGGAVTGIGAAFLFYQKAQYIKARNEHGRGWSYYPDDEPA
jgi:membrane associated rhomboid family serine protease